MIKQRASSIRNGMVKCVNFPTIIKRDTNVVIQPVTIAKVVREQNGCGLKSKSTWHVRL